MTFDYHEFSWQGPFDDFNEFTIAVTTTDGPLPGPWPGAAVSGGGTGGGVLTAKSACSLASERRME